MKAAIIAGKGLVELRNVPTPKVGPGEVLVQMRSCGVCGTDIEKVHGDHITPPVLGHEVAGEISEVGRNVQGFGKGDRVIVHHHISCGTCYYCKSALETLCDAYPKSNLDPCGFAEFFRVPNQLIAGGTMYKIPSSLGYDEASQVEPTACCIRAIRKADFKTGASVAVFGVGPAGLTHVELLKFYGAASIFAIDMLEHRRNMAKRLGANAAFDPSDETLPESIMEQTNGRGVDLAIVATGNPKAIQQAVTTVRKGGTLILFGAPARGAMVSLDVSQLFLREIRLQSSYSTSETEMRVALDLIATGKIRPSLIITHQLPLGRVSEAISLAERGKEVVKVIVHNQ